MSHEEQTHTSARRVRHTQEAEPGSSWQQEACTLEAVERNVWMLQITKQNKTQTSKLLLLTIFAFCLFS